MSCFGYTGISVSCLIFIWCLVWVAWKMKRNTRKDEHCIYGGYFLRFCFFGLVFGCGGRTTPTERYDIRCLAFWIAYSTSCWKLINIRCPVVFWLVHLFYDNWYRLLNKIHNYLAGIPCTCTNASSMFLFDSLRQPTDGRLLLHGLQAAARCRQPCG